MKKRDFLITSLQVWDIEIGSTIKNTALEISKSNRVLYVNTPMDHATWLRKSDKRSYTQRMRVIRGECSPLRQINENMWVLDCPFMVYSINKVPFAPLFNALNYLNNRRIASFVSTILQKLGFAHHIHLIDTDIYKSFYLKELLNPEMSIYYRRDYVIGEPYWRKHGSRLEPLLCAKSDIVLANSLYFAEELKRYNAHTYDIETGVNLELYDHRKVLTVPPDLAVIPHPIVGYIGSIHSARLDIELLYASARQRPQYSFVFTGPEDDLFKTHLLHDLPNVYFLGRKEVEELPAYIMGYDVCINPQLVNSLTIGNYPLKIDEYLALGKPTVATRTHTMSHIFADYVLLSDDQFGFLTCLDRAMEEVEDDPKRAARIAFAQNHSWANSVKKIYNIIDSFSK